MEIKRNYAFVEFKNLDDAIDAQKRSHGTVFDGRTITVEFVESSRLGKDRCACVGLCCRHVHLPELFSLGFRVYAVSRWWLCFVC